MLLATLFPLTFVDIRKCNLFARTYRNRFLLLFHVVIQIEFRVQFYVSDTFQISSLQFANETNTATIFDCNRVISHLLTVLNDLSSCF